MKICEVLVSDIKLKEEYKFENNNLAPYNYNSTYQPPFIILLEYEEDSPPIRARGDYIASLLSLVLRRKVDICKSRDHPYIISGLSNRLEQIPTPCYERFRPSFFFSEMSPLSEFAPEDEKNRMELFIKAYNSINKLDEEKINSIRYSLNLHQLSYFVKRESEELAFALLVASMETLSQTFSKIDTTWDNYGKRDEWDKFFVKESIDKTIANKIRKILIKDEYFVLKKFVNFIVEYLPESYWTLIDPDICANYNYHKWEQNGGICDTKIKYSTSDNEKERLIEEKNFKLSIKWPDEILQQMHLINPSIEFLRNRLVKKTLRVL